MADHSSRRVYYRYPVQYPVIFGWESCVGEGLLTSLSFSGYSVQCDRTPQLGEEVRVGVLLPDQGPALLIEGGRIKWVSGHQFGVEFLNLPLATRLRLNRMLRDALIYRLKSRAARQDHHEVSA